MPIGSRDELLPVTVVVPTWRRPDWLRNCLDGLLAQMPQPERVLVVARPDDFETLEVLRSYGDQVDLTEVCSPGHVAPIRAALKAVQSPVMMIIDDDARPLRSDWVRTLYEAVSRPRVGVVGSRVVEENVVRRVTKNSGRVTWTGRVVANVAGRNDEAPVEVDCLPEGNWAWRTELLRSLRIGAIFDEGDASMYGLDLCLQARQLGWSVQFVSGAPIRHYSAPRVAAPERTDRNNAVASYTRNVTYVALSRFGSRRAAFVLWSTVVGDSAIYGLLSFALDLARGRVRPATAIYAVRGRLAGIEYWRRERSDR